MLEALNLECNVSDAGLGYEVIFVSTLLNVKKPFSSATFNETLPKRQVAALTVQGILDIIPTAIYIRSCKYNS